MLTAYLVTLTVSALMLSAIDSLPAFAEPLAALPAVFAATVDSLHDRAWNAPLFRLKEAGQFPGDIAAERIHRLVHGGNHGAGTFCGASVSRVPGAPG